MKRIWTFLAILVALSLPATRSEDKDSETCSAGYLLVF
jgi:hypothetical protein